jgi:hypothetical protein
MAAASGIMSVAGGLAKAREARKAALVSKTNAALSVLTAQNKAVRAREAGKRRAGEIRAAYAGAGVEIDSGSALSMKSAALMDAEGAAQDLIQQGNIDAANGMLEAEAYKRKGSMAVTEGIMGGLSSLASYYSAQAGASGGMGRIR